MFKWITKEDRKELQNFELLKNLNNIDIQVGWLDSLKSMVIEIERFCKENDVELPNISQIKTKFGGLRFYCNKVENEDLKKIIENFNVIMNNTCEYCGSNNNVKTIIRGRYVLTLCEEERLDTDVDYNEFMKIKWGE